VCLFLQFNLFFKVFLYKKIFFKYFLHDDIRIYKKIFLIEKYLYKNTLLCITKHTPRLLSRTRIIILGWVLVIENYHIVQFDMVHFFFYSKHKDIFSIIYASIKIKYFFLKG
jgi:hypothetical protein